MEFQEYLRALRKRGLVVVASVLFGVAVMGVLAAALPQQYTSEAKLFVAPRSAGTPQDLVQGNAFAQSRVKSYVQLVRSESVLRPVIAELGLIATVPDLADRIEPTVPVDTVILSIQVTDTSASRSADIANAIASQVQVISAALEPKDKEDNSVVALTVVESALPPQKVSSPNIKLYLGFGLLAGLAMGFGLAIAREVMDRGLHRESDLRHLTAAPILGQIPQDRSADAHPVLEASRGAKKRSEAIRQLRTNFQFLAPPDGRRSFVVTSSKSGEGKSTIAINLARAQADLGLSVCLVDACIRKPSLARYLGLTERPGLTNILTSDVSVGFATQRWGVGKTVDVIAAGAPTSNPSELLSGQSMGELIADLENRYDVVIVDAPPLMPLTDATILAKVCAGAILVSESGRKAVTRSELNRALESLAGVEARLLGIVMNRVSTRDVDADVFPPSSFKAPTLSWAD